MALQHTRVTEAEFDHFISQPENAERDFEHIGGKIFDIVSTHYCSVIGGNIAFFIMLYLRENKIAGYVTAPNGGYVVSGERYMPDVGIHLESAPAEAQP